MHQYDIYFSNSILCFLTQCPPGMKQQVLTFYTKLLAHIRQPLLPHINVHRPVQVSLSHSVCVQPLFNQPIDASLCLHLRLSLLSTSETDPPVRRSSGGAHGKRRDPVPVYSLCQAQAGPVPCQLLPGGRSSNEKSSRYYTACLQTAASQNICVSAEQIKASGGVEDHRVGGRKGRRRGSRHRSVSGGRTAGSGDRLGLQPDQQQQQQRQQLQPRHIAA